MIWSLVLTAVLLLVYLQGGGMWSIGLSGLAELAEAHPDYYGWQQSRRGKEQRDDQKSSKRSFSISFGRASLSHPNISHLHR